MYIFWQMNGGVQSRYINSEMTGNQGEIHQYILWEMKGGAKRSSINSDMKGSKPEFTNVFFVEIKCGVHNRNINWEMVTKVEFTKVHILRDKRSSIEQ